MCHTETCRRSGYTFWPSNPRQGVFFRGLTLKQGAKFVRSLQAVSKFYPGSGSGSTPGSGSIPGSPHQLEMVT